MRILIIFLFLCNSIFAQYDSTKYDLIKTTYQRSFDTNIIYKYLHSNSAQKTKAALLTIAQSEDTSFVPELIKLNLLKYGGEVCFTLGQIGECKQSINFLWNYLNSSPPSNQYPKIFYALGKIGDENDLNKLIEFYNSSSNPLFPYEGISEAILQFQIRGVKNDGAKVILVNEVIQNLSTKKRKLIALFTLARYGSSNLTDRQFSKLLSDLHSKKDNLYNTEFLQMVLMNINKPVNMKYESLLKDLQNNSEKFSFELNLIKVLHFIHFKDFPYPQKNLDIYFDIISSKNSNIAIQSAISLKNLKETVADSFSTLIKESFGKILLDKTSLQSLRGEIFLSSYELTGDYERHEIILSKLELPIKYQIRFFAIDPNNERAFNRLSNIYLDSSDLAIKIDALTELFSFQNKTKTQNDFITCIANALNSKYAPLVSIAADGIDSSFISNSIQQLKEIISSQILSNLNNPDFLEATMSLINLAEKIDRDFFQSVIEKTKSSKLYSIKKFVAQKTGSSQIGTKELDYFSDIFMNAFKYKTAQIITSKGKITIKFNSEIAPISVANFCMLAKKGFYNGIIFHRVVPGFVIQAGDPTATGWGGPGYDIVSEFSDSNFGIGYVGMASAGKDTEGSQFFIMQGSYPHLDGRYTLFAQVINGLDVVYNITQEDKIISIELSN